MYYFAILRLDSAPEELSMYSCRITYSGGGLYNIYTCVRPPGATTRAACNIPPTMRCNRAEIENECKERGFFVSGRERRVVLYYYFLLGLWKNLSGGGVNGIETGFPVQSPDRTQPDFKCC